MASGNVMAQEDKGMEVKRADDTTLGKLAPVWHGIDPTGSVQRCDEDECSRREVYLPHGRGTRSGAYQAQAAVSGTIALNRHRTKAIMSDRLWRQWPPWLPAEAFNADFDYLVRPHPK